MGKKENRIYLEVITRRYRRANRAAMGVILNQFCSVCGQEYVGPFKQACRQAAG